MIPEPIPLSAVPAPVRRALGRALVAARRGMGRGLRPPDGAALIGAPFWAEARETGWSADRLLSKTSKKTGLALAFEPDAERWTALQASNVHEIWLAGLHPHHD
ncbi:MAG: hypothetical protein AAFV29_12335, partial [Myxococcota bacterium]